MENERLTRRLIPIPHEADCAYCTGEYITKRGCSMRCELRKRQLEKLAAYEDIGTPSKFAELTGLLKYLADNFNNGVADMGVIKKNLTKLMKSNEHERLETECK